LGGILPVDQFREFPQGDGTALQEFPGPPDISGEGFQFQNIGPARPRMDRLDILFPDPERFPPGKANFYLVPDPGYQGGTIFIHHKAFKGAQWGSIPQPEGVRKARAGDRAAIPILTTIGPRTNLTNSYFDIPDFTRIPLSIRVKTRKKLVSDTRPPDNCGVRHKKDYIRKRWRGAMRRIAGVRHPAFFRARD
jgi:hypothetical protein